MSRYILIRRLRGPAFLLLIGVIALLNQADILTWGHAWPLLLILAGVLQLAERAAFASDGYTTYPGVPYAGAPPANPGAPPQNPEQPGSSIVPHNGDWPQGGGQ
ncbi:MAG: LiaF transmembrane domain-containing protein [Acidobacteriota bacterium]